MTTNHTLSVLDYAITLQDESGRRAILSINGDSIKEAIYNGVDPDKAVEQAEGNAFENAIARGLIGSDAWLVKVQA
jgi:hypothetical protein